MAIKQRHVSPLQAALERRQQKAADAPADQAAQLAKVIAERDAALQEIANLRHRVMQALMREG